MHERVKSLDKIHFPPYLIIGLFFVPILVFIYSRVLSQDESIQKLQERNLLLAMRKTQDQVEYGEDEITGTEELAIASTQYKQVV
jgi:hypothetical protein